MDFYYKNFKMTANNDQANRPNVIITGFGPFRNISENPSWLAIKDGLDIDKGVNIIIEEMEVSYEAVDIRVPRLWDDYKPILVVHVGLAAHQPHIRLERIARDGPYHKTDIKSYAPHIYDDDSAQGEISNSTNCTKFNLEKVCEKFAHARCQGDLDLEIEISEDAGLYVCEYTYKTSLSIDPSSVFVHIPDTRNASIESIKRCLKFVIEELIDEALMCYEPDNNVDSGSTGYQNSI